MDKELFRRIGKIEKDVSAISKKLDALYKYLIENIAMLKDMVDAIEAKLTTDTSGRFEKKGGVEK